MIWKNLKEKDGFQLQVSLKIPDGATTFSFADMDADGSVDFVFPTCTQSDCFINILFILWEIVYSISD